MAVQPSRDRRRCWGARTRTSTNRARTCRAAITPRPTALPANSIKAPSTNHDTNHDAATCEVDLPCGAGLRWVRRPPPNDMGGQMNKGGLVSEVAKRTGLSKADVARVVDASIDAVRDAVVKGERVTLADFGTFERKHRNERIARNPRKPDVPIVVPARDLPSFTPGKEFRAQVLQRS